MSWDGSRGPRETGAISVPGEHLSQRAEAPNVPSEVAPCHLGAASVLVEDTAWVCLPTAALCFLLGKGTLHTAQTV